MKRKQSGQHRLDAAALTEAFFQASDFAEDGRAEASRELLHRVISCTPAQDEGYPRKYAAGATTGTATMPLPMAIPMQARVPTPRIILSSMRNLLAEICVDDMLADPMQAAAHRQQAVGHAEVALELWPENSAAALTLAHLLRESGNLRRALALYKDVATRTVPFPSHEETEEENSDSDDEDGTPYDWRREFIYAPHHHNCLPVALSNLAVLLSQMGLHDEAEVAIGRIGCQARIAPNVWRCANNDDEGAATTTTTPKAAPARIYPRAIPKPLLACLQHAFNKDARYWAENHYEENPGYFSWWYNVSMPPLNMVEALIRDIMLPLVDECNASKFANSDDPIVGAEWWVHKRKVGRNLGHALHWDTDESSLNRLGAQGLRHPCWSSVCYLGGNSTESSGKTVVFELRTDGKEYPKKCWVAKPTGNGDVLVFDGSLLHGVLPGRGGSASSGAADAAGGSGDGDDTRLTLMVGFWSVDLMKNRQASKRASRRRGGALSLPRPVRSTQWPNDLDLSHLQNRDDAAGSEKELPSGKTVSADPSMVQCCQPAFVRVPPAMPSSRQLPVVPASIQQRFWVRDAGTFRRALLDGSVE
jgi:tetratricopeptide (TPR) repeat protein